MNGSFSLHPPSIEVPLEVVEAVWVGQSSWEKSCLASQPRDYLGEAIHLCPLVEDTPESFPLLLSPLKVWSRQRLDIFSPLSAFRD